MSPSADLWDRCLENLKNDVSQQSFETWLKPTTAIFIEPNTLKVRVPNHFFKEWIRTHYEPQIQKALKSVHPEQLEIQFDVENSVPQAETSQGPSLPTEASQPPLRKR